MAVIQTDLVRDPLTNADVSTYGPQTVNFTHDNGHNIADRAAPLSIAGKFFAGLTRWRVMMLAQCLDMAVVISMSMLIYEITGKGNNLPWQALTAAVIVAITVHFSFYQGRLYEMDALAHPASAIKSLFLRWSVIFIMLAGLVTLAHQPGLLSRIWFAGFYGSGFLALALERLMIARMIRNWIGRGHHSLSVAIVGGNELTEKLIARFKDNPWGIRIIGVFDDRNRDYVGHIAGVKMLGTIDDLLNYSTMHEVDLVVVTLPIAASERIQEVIRRLRQHPLNVRVLPGLIGLERISPIRLERTELPGVQLISVAERPISEMALLMKGAVDRLAALFGILLLSPLLLFCVVGIAISSPGPILFRQPRIGYKGRIFSIYKFRTMHMVARPNTALTQRDDPRVFRFGRFLRKTSVDELPQLFNVLRGDMSLVGPRPHMPEARAAGKLYFEAVAEYADRQRVKPGMTGWAQVNGWRGPTETVEQIERRVEHDIYYIENWSLVLDFIIIIKTALVGFYGKNAF